MGEFRLGNGRERSGGGEGRVDFGGNRRGLGEADSDHIFILRNLTIRDAEPDVWVGRAAGDFIKPSRYFQKISCCIFYSGARLHFCVDFDRGGTKTPGCFDIYVIFVLLVFSS